MKFEYDALANELTLRPTIKGIVKVGVTLASIRFVYDVTTGFYRATVLKLSPKLDKAVEDLKTKTEVQIDKLTD